MANDYILTGTDGRFFPDRYWPKVYGYWPGYYQASGKIVSEASPAARVVEAGAISRLAATSVARVVRI